MRGHERWIKADGAYKGGSQMRMLKSLIVGLAGATLASAPVAAQISLGTNGDKFVEALRKNEGSKALSLFDTSGPGIVSHRALDGSTPLHIVVRNRNGSWLNFLLEHGADKNAADRNGDTPLILAARSGYGDGVAQLLRARVDINRNNRLGETALIVAVQQRQTPIVSTLLKLGADPDRRDHTGYSAREHAKRDTRNREMLRLIETVKSRASQIAPAKP